jgi:hypothetical protein
VFRNVIVGVDEQAGGRDAIALARDLVLTGGKLTLAHVYVDLLVVGSCRRGLIRRVCAGNDTDDELNGAPCAVAPAGHANQSSVYREIGVADNRGRVAVPAGGPGPASSVERRH